MYLYVIDLMISFRLFIWSSFQRLCGKPRCWEDVWYSTLHTERASDARAPSIGDGRNLRNGSRTGHVRSASNVDFHLLSLLSIILRINRN